jgi:release factor glutamine methyltransferase
MYIYEYINYLKAELLPISGEYSLSEAERILQHVLNCSRSDLYLTKNRLVNDKNSEWIKEIIHRKKRNEPLPYILNKAYFHSLEFYVDRNTLIPRPDTEILIETILDNEKSGRVSFLDMGTGSGAIAAILVDKNPSWFAVASDISISALKVAKKNSGGILLINADELTAFKPVQCFDFIVSNPPYISDEEMNDLDPDVKNFEPYSALYGGIDGLDFYRIIAKKSIDILKPQGRIYCETGFSQAQNVKSIFAESGFIDIKTIQDLGGRDRVIMCRSAR